MTTLRIRSLAHGFAIGLLTLSSSTWAQVFVSNYHDATVQEFSTSGDFLGTFIAGGSGGLAHPNDLHFGPDGNLYVASDTGIKVYDGLSGAYIKDFTSAYALDFAFDKTGNVYAVDNVNVLKYGADGTLLATYTEASGVSTPQGILATADGSLLVTNTYAGAYFGTVTRLDPGNGSFTTFATGLGEAVGITAGPDGRYYVAQYAFYGSNPNTVQVIGAGGGAASTWSQGGNLDGAVYLAFGGDKLFVTSYYENTVRVFDAATGASLGGFSSQGGGAEGVTYRAALVPEPSSLALLGIGVVGVLGVTRRRTALRSRAREGRHDGSARGPGSDAASCRTAC